MDSIDMKIVSILQKNARESASSIAKQVGMAVSSVTERIRRLENQGVILQYTAVVDQSKIEGGVAAMMSLKVDLEYFDELSEELPKAPNVTSFYILTGEYDFMLQINAVSADEFRRVHHNIMSRKGVLQVKTNYILGSKANKTEQTI